MRLANRAASRLIEAAVRRLAPEGPDRVMAQDGELVEVER